MLLFHTADRWPEANERGEGEPLRLAERFFVVWMPERPRPAPNVPAGFRRGANAPYQMRKADGYALHRGPERQPLPVLAEWRFPAWWEC
ncbi:hypothetical protein AZ09_03105 [Acetobacter aceti 1023]|nr:hypothetical protein AZ09_03105 [Acetobacter aceti 1023]